MFSPSAHPAYHRVGFFARLQSVLFGAILSITMPDKKDPGAFVRLHPHDYKFAQKIAKQRGMPLSIWLRVVIMDRIEKEMERENGK